MSKLLTIITLGILSFFLISCDEKPTTKDSNQLTPEQAREIARDAYIYGNPLVDSYRILHAYNVDTTHPEFKATWNQLLNVARVYTHEDTAVQTPNSDTPYSFLGLDLRAEPIVLTLPKIDDERYYSVQLIDLYTHIFGYLGSRATGNQGGSFLIAGPNWQGEKPEGIDKILRSETELGLAIYRTQLFSPQDIEQVRQIQSGYQVQPLSVFLGTDTSPSAPAIEFIQPLSAETIRTSPAVFEQLNFILQFSPVHSSEKELMDRFAKLNIGAGKTFALEQFPAEIQEAIQQGIADAWMKFDELKQKADRGELSSSEVFGSREFLQNNYQYRKAAAVLGIWGNSAEEAIYPTYFTDADGEPLNGQHQYTVHFAKNQLPPVNAFWSLTMYRLPESLFVDNPLNRYLLSSTMLNEFKRDENGDITFYIQKDSPGPELESNWLPAPSGAFSVSLRLYWPKQEALDSTWQAPPLLKSG